MIMSYNTSVYSSTCHFQVMIVLGLNLGRKKSILTLNTVVKFPDWVLHLVVTLG